MTFNHLSETEFENFCFDLLCEMGLQKVNWRKGTGLGSSPADSGRDIECEYCRYDPLLQEMVVEKWFVECKHYHRGVPFEKINNALSWASAQRPDRLIIIASNFLSNSCKGAINEYILQNKPQYKVQIWEKVFIEQKLEAYPHLLKQYNIQHTEKIIHLINPNHIEYIKHPPFNTLQQLFDSWEKMPCGDMKKICEILSITYCDSSVVFQDMCTHESYVNFIKSKLNELKNSVCEQFAVRSFTMLTFYMLQSQIWKSPSEMSLKSQRFIEHSITHKQEITKLASKLIDDTLEIDFSDKEVYEMFHRPVEDYENQIREMNDLYNHFCDVVIRYLIEESKI